MNSDGHGVDRLETALKEAGHQLSDAEHRLIQIALGHRHDPPARNINRELDERSTLGERAADAMARRVGSWSFIIAQASVLAIWIVINSLAWINDWDPYPFILLNLVLSFQAAFTGPIVMMSQNRQSDRDRAHAEQDYEVNRHAELEVAAIQARLDDLAGRQWDALVALQHEQLELLRRIDDLQKELHSVVVKTT